VKIELPYGREPYTLDLGDRAFEVLRAPHRPASGLVENLVDSALARHPLPVAARITVVLSDPSRSEPRAVFLAALRRLRPTARWTVAIATGTHGPARISELGIPPELLQGATIVNHDGHSDTDLVDLGSTSRGTPVRLHRCVIDTDLVIATGCIRPHYFAGFGAGVKALFPGLGEARAIRINHRLKTEPGSRAGIVDGNPCRADLEEAVSLVPTPTYLLNAVCGPDSQIHDVVAGDLVRAFRDGVTMARPWFTVRSKPAPTVIASDALPVTASLYQAAKIAAAVAPLVDENGTVVVVAECAEGTGPLEVVNEAIFRIGVLPRLPRGARLLLVSSLGRDEVAKTLVEYAPSAASAIASSGTILVIPNASQLLCEASS
jgi:nickel-dependent lactate racemase